MQVLRPFLRCDEPDFEFRIGRGCSRDRDTDCHALLTALFDHGRCRLYLCHELTVREGGHAESCA